MYGFAGPISPELDTLAEESVVFQNCFAQSPWTQPSVASLFTSLYPQVHGLTKYDGQYRNEIKNQSGTGILSDQAVTLAESLGEVGCQTAAFVSNPWVASGYGFAQGFDVFKEHYLDRALKLPADILIHDARTWMESRNSEKPFFLYLHFMDVHAPYFATRSDFDVLIGSPSLGGDRTLAESEVPYHQFPRIEVRADWASNGMRHTLSYWRTKYVSGVRAFDRHLSSLLEFLRRAGELDRSYLIVTSDHGEELFEHRGWSHGSNLHDYQLHIPLLVRNPAAANGGRRIENIVELVDLMPTLLSITGAETKAHLQGQDVSSYLRKNPTEDSRVSFATATSKNPALYSIRTRQHKFIFNVDTGKSQLFDLLQDPGEEQDHSAREPKMAQQLEDELKAHIVESVASGAFQPEVSPISDEDLERLRSLGYLR